MTWTLTTSPLIALTAWAPASVAAFTAATSPTTTAVRADDRFSGFGLVSGGIECEAELIEIPADGFTEAGAVLPDAGGEDERISAVQFEEKGANPMPSLVDQNIQSQPRLGVALVCLRLDVADVVSPAGEGF